MSLIQPKSQEWLDNHYGTIGGTAAAVIAGHSLWMTLGDLYDYRLKLKPYPDVSDSPDIRRGMLLEPVALMVLEEKLGKDVTPWEQDLFCRNPHYAFAHVLPDAIDADGDYWDVKCPRPAGVSQAVLDGLPPYYYCTAQHACMVLETSQYGIAMFDSVTCDIHLFMVKRSDDFVEALIDLERAFDAACREGRRPETEPQKVPVTNAPRGKLHRIDDPAAVVAARRVRDTRELVAVAKDTQARAVEGLRAFMPEDGGGFSVFDGNERIGHFYPTREGLRTYFTNKDGNEDDGS